MARFSVIDRKCVKLQYSLQVLYKDDRLSSTVCDAHQLLVIDTATASNRGEMGGRGGGEDFSCDTVGSRMIDIPMTAESPAYDS